MRRLWHHHRQAGADHSTPNLVGFRADQTSSELYYCPTPANAGEHLIHAITVGCTPVTVSVILSSVFPTRPVNAYEARRRAFELMISVRLDTCCYTVGNVARWLL